MNTSNNHLINEETLKELDERARKKYNPVPGALEYAAKRKLNGEKEAYVSKTSGGKLSKWAAKKRKKKKKS